MNNHGLKGWSMSTFLLDTVSSSDFGFHIFMLGIQKYLKDNMSRRISSFPKPASPLRSQLSKAAVSSHQSSNSGHHCRQLSCIFLISIQCFRAWHKVETEQIRTEWNWPTFISTCLNCFSSCFHGVLRPSPSPGWLTASLSTTTKFLFSVFFHCWLLPLVYDILQVLTKFSTKFLWVEINFFP